VFIIVCCLNYDFSSPLNPPKGDFWGWGLFCLNHDFNKIYTINTIFSHTDNTDFTDLHRFFIFLPQSSQKNHSIHSQSHKS